jgi:ankyrin repeat protein
VYDRAAESSQTARQARIAIERIVDMRVLGVLIIAAAFSTFVGCDRAKGNAVPATTKSPSAALPDLPAPPVETDPAKMLRHALILTHDVDKVNQILTEHPEVINKEISKSWPIWMACESQSLPLVKAVVEHGADLKIKNKEHQTILWAAVVYGNIDIVKYLIDKGADPKALQDDQETLLWAADTKPMGQLLITAGVDPQHKNVNGDTALHRACRYSIPDMVELLLDNGLSVEAVGHWNMRPIHCATATLVGDSRPVLNMLAKHDVDLNSHGAGGHTALHECALTNRYESAEWLLKHHADPTLIDDTKRTPVDVAMISGKTERIKLINLLIDYGAQGNKIPIPKDE